MENQTTLERLNGKITQLLQQFHSVREENELIRVELMGLKAEKAIKDLEIENLTNQNIMKDLEIEEIVNKIESILGQ
jgi:hypothetical protein